MFDTYDTSDVAIFAIGADINQLSEFIDVFGMRFTGLIDNAGVYSSWRVPSAEAPYPQDYVIDQDGIVRYWADQFDPQAVMAVIDGLLATGVEERPPDPTPRRLNLRLSPNPGQSALRVTAGGLGPDAALVEVCDALGRVVDRFPVRDRQAHAWNPALPAGSYLLRLRAGPQTTTARAIVLP